MTHEEIAVARYLAMRASTPSIPAASVVRQAISDATVFVTEYHAWQQAEQAKSREFNQRRIREASTNSWGTMTNARDPLS